MSHESAVDPLPWRRLFFGAFAIATYGLVCEIAGFYLSAWFFRRTHLAPSPLARQVVTAFLGFLVMAVVPVTFGFIHRPRELRTWQAVLAAIGRIAKGDFSARVEVRGLNGGPAGNQHPFTQLAHGINDMAAELDRLERMRQEFVSDVSHELQSPLTSIRGFAKALKEDDIAPADRLRYLDIIAVEAERLSRLSDNLLKLTALEADAPVMQPASYRLDEQLRRVVLAAEPQWTAKRLDVEAELEPSTIVADEALLERVWTNLLHNAVKFTPDGGALTVRSTTRDGELVVEVRDTGIGIAQEDQPRVFERFFKADKSRSRDAGGSGLGLALARKIVSLHEGRIALESAPGAGATFSVSLPVEAALAPKRAVGDHPAP